MALTQYYVASSIDGYIADPAGSLDWLLQFDGVPRLTEHLDAFLSGVGALAMGAATYRFVLDQGPDAWPYRDQRTWVFTHRELPLVPGADIVLTQDDVGDVHARMVQAAGGRNVWLVGGGDLVGQFAARGLLDEIWLGLAPVVLGGGAPLLPRRLPGNLDLEEVTRFADSFVVLRYTVPRSGRATPHGPGADAPPLRDRRATPRTAG